jgi:hypothetical protein
MCSVPSIFVNTPSAPRRGVKGEDVKTLPIKKKYIDLLTKSYKTAKNITANKMKVNKAKPI